MERVQAKSGRWYLTDEGVYVPSVTTILSVWPRGRGFDKWLGDSESYDAATAKRDAAGERGSVVHDAIASLLQTGSAVLPDDADPKCGKLIQGFLNWYRDARPLVESVETFLLGPGYAGTDDLVCILNHERWDIDVKTSGAVYDSHHVQICAYARARAHMGLPPIERRGILWLKTTTKRGYQMVESSHTEAEDWSAFRCCQDLFTYINGGEPEFYEDKAPLPTEFRLEEE